MILTHEEKTLLLIYYEGDKERTLKNLHSMRKALQPDEKALYNLTTGVIEKLSAMTNQAFQALDLFDGMGVKI